MSEESQQRRGYLTEDFRLFHLKDPQMRPVEFHYHTFHKIMVLLSGQVTYAIEGKSYAMEPGDMVLVCSGSLHRPVVSSAIPYERLILYISPAFLRQAGGPDCNLETCFFRARDQFSHVLRPSGDRLAALLRELEAALTVSGFGQALLCRGLLLEFLILLTREMSDHQLRYVSSDRADEKILGVLRYLNLHLGENIPVERLAQQFYISKFYLMRRFKEETGYTIHGYVTEKRLILAREKIASGMSLGQVAESCGFGDYSSFSRSYKKRFGVSPTGTPLGLSVPEKPLD